MNYVQMSKMFMNGKLVEHSLDTKVHFAIFKQIFTTLFDLVD